MDKWLPNERWYDNLDVLGSDYYQSAPGLHLDPNMDPKWLWSVEIFVFQYADLSTVLIWVNICENAGYPFAAQALRDRANAITVVLDPSMPEHDELATRALLMYETRPTMIVDAARWYEAKGYGYAGNALRDRAALLRIARRRVVPAPEIVSPWLPKTPGTSLPIEAWFDDLDIIGSDAYQSNPGLHAEVTIQGPQLNELMAKAASRDVNQVLRWAKEYQAAGLPFAAQAMRDRAATLMLPLDLGMSEAEQLYAQAHFQYETRPEMLVEAARVLESHDRVMAALALRERAALLRVARRRPAPAPEIVWPWPGLPEGQTPAPQPSLPQS